MLIVEIHAGKENVISCANHNILDFLSKHAEVAHLYDLLEDRTAQHRRQHQVISSQ